MPGWKRVRAAVAWRLTQFWQQAANLPSIAKVTGTKEARGFVRSIQLWREWVTTRELREEIQKAPSEHRARMVMKMHDAQSRRWRISIVVAVLTVIGSLMVLEFWGEIGLGAVVIGLLVALYYAGRKDEVVPGAEAPKHALHEGMPLASLRESITDILTNRSKTEAHVAVQHYEHGWRFQLSFTSSRPDNDKIIRDLEQGLGAPHNSITLVEDPANAARELGTIQLTDPLEKTPYLSVFGPNSLTITEPLPVGMNQDGSELKLNLLRTNWLFVGRSDSGKSTALNAVGVRLSECRDVHLSSIDVTGAVTFAVHRGCIRRRAETESEAIKLLQDELAIIDERTRRMSANLESGDVVSSLEPSEQTPARVLLIDELPALADNKQFISLLLLYLMRGRKVACIAVIGTQGVSERVAGSATFREAVHGTALFACGELDIKNALGQHARQQGWRADTLLKQGACYIRDRKRRLPEVSRFSDISAQDVADRSLELQHYQPKSVIPEILSEVEAAFDLAGSEKLLTQELIDRLEDDWTPAKLQEALKSHSIGRRQFTDANGKNVRGYIRSDVNAAIERLGAAS